MSCGYLLCRRNACHQQPYGVAVCVSARDVGDDAAMEHDEDAIGQRKDFVEFCRYEQNGTAAIALCHNLGVNEFNRSDIKPASRLCGDEELERAREFTCDDDFLLVAA